MEENKKTKVKNWVKESLTLRMFTVGFLIVVMLIPLSYIKILIRERKQNQEDVIAKIDKNWGSEVLIYGPILKIPYKYYTKETVLNEG
jgi:inner membrane protein